MSHYTADVQVMQLYLYETRPIQREIQMVCKWSHKSLLHLQCVASVNARFICSSQWLQQYSLIWKAIMCFKWMNYSVPEPPGLTSLFKCAWPAISFQSKTKGAANCWIRRKRWRQDPLQLADMNKPNQTLGGARGCHSTCEQVFYYSGFMVPEWMSEWINEWIRMKKIHLKREQMSVICIFKMLKTFSLS